MTIGIAVWVLVVIAGLAMLARSGAVGASGLRLPEPGAPTPPRTDRDRLVDIWKALGPIAMVCATGCALIAASTFGPDPLVVPQALVAVCFVPMVPLMFIAVATLMRMERKHPGVWRTIESGAPAWPLAAMALVVFMVIAVSGTGGPPGDPEERDGGYFLVNHGVFTEITADEYEKYEGLSRRSAAGVSGGLYTPGIALGLYARRLGGSGSAPQG